MSSFSRRIFRGNTASRTRIKKLPWSSDEYVKLDPSDFDPSPPTPERRIRVAAAVATYIRDETMRGETPSSNAEAVRALLVMDDAAWARDIGDVAGKVDGYDPEDPFVRFEQIRKALSD